MVKNIYYAVLLQCYLQALKIDNLIAAKRGLRLLGINCLSLRYRMLPRRDMSEALLKNKENKMTTAQLLQITRYAGYFHLLSLSYAVSAYKNNIRVEAYKCSIIRIIRLPIWHELGFLKYDLRARRAIKHQVSCLQILSNIVIITKFIIAILRSIGLASTKYLTNL